MTENNTEDNNEGRIEEYINPLLPLTIADMEQTTLCKSIDLDTLQLQVDIINVFENRVDINTFSKERQQIIKNYYRFSPVSPASLSGGIAQKAASRQGKG